MDPNPTTSTFPAPDASTSATTTSIDPSLSARSGREFDSNPAPTNRLAAELESEFITSPREDDSGQVRTLAAPGPTAPEDCVGVTPLTGQAQFSPNDEERIAEAQRRAQILEALAALRSQTPGISLRKASVKLGVPLATLHRYQKAGAAGDFAALMPRTHLCGRKAKRLTLEEAQLARRLAIKTGSAQAAAELLADSDFVRPEIIPHLLKLTPSIREQIESTVELDNLYRGPDKSRLEGYWQPRDLTYIDAAGQEREILPGDLFERDDMTVNFAWWVEWPWGGDPCSDKFGVRLLRGQLLVQIDVASLRVLSFELLARRQDSYRMDDVWAWMGRGYQDIGLPRIGERLERGIWEGSAITGKRPKAKDGIEFEEGHTSTKLRVGGLQALGVRIIRSYSPTTKIIENRFNRVQSIQGVIPGQLGRKRGEMERENALWMRCRQGKEDPRNHFVSQAEAAKYVVASFAWLNSHPVDGRVYSGVPDELWLRAQDENPNQKLSVDQTWLFARERREVAIRRGIAQVRMTGPEGPVSYFFSNPEMFARLGSGYPVVVYFDPHQPDAPAVVVDNQAGTGAGKILCVAEAVQAVPQFSLAEENPNGESGYARRKAFAEAVRTEYRAIGLAGSRGTALSEASDGRGGLIRREVNRITDVPDRDSAIPDRGRLGRSGPESSEVTESRLDTLSRPVQPSAAPAAPTHPILRAHAAQKESDARERARIAAEPDDFTSLENSPAPRQREYKDAGYAVSMKDLEDL